MGYQTWIADKIREYGVEVIEVHGWKTRGSSSFNPTAVVAHHTASRAGSDAPALGIVTHGRSDLAGPLAQVLLSRSGKAYIVAAGRANHAGRGGALGLNSNSQVFGIEAENNGVGEPWPQAQLDAYYKITAALLDGVNQNRSRVVGHKEWAPNRKIDPAGIDMDDFRNRVVAVGKSSGATPPPASTPSGSKYKAESGSVLGLYEKGPRVKVWQQLLIDNANQKIKADGLFGPSTEVATKNFQRFFGLKVDGLAGPKTMGVMEFVMNEKKKEKYGSSRPTLKQGSRGEDVKYLQKKLGYLAADGVFGPKTKARVMKMQRAWGLRPDGIVGPKTWAKID